MSTLTLDASTRHRNLAHEAARHLKRWDADRSNRRAKLSYFDTRWELEAQLGGLAASMLIEQAVLA